MLLYQTKLINFAWNHIDNVNISQQNYTFKHIKTWIIIQLEMFNHFKVQFI